MEIPPNAKTWSKSSRLQSTESLEPKGLSPRVAPKPISQPHAPSLSVPEIAQPQGSGISLNGGQSLDAESRKSPATERYLHEQNNFKLGATRKPEGETNQRWDLLRGQRKSVSPSRDIGANTLLRQDNPVFRIESYDPGKKPSPDLVEAGAVKVPNVDNSRKFGEI